MPMDGIEIRTSARNTARCNRCGQPVEWVTEVATGHRVPLKPNAVAWKTRFDRNLWETVETVAREDRHVCPAKYRNQQ